MSSKKNKSKSRNKNSQLAKKLKKKLGKGKNTKKNKIKKDKMKKGKGQSVKKSSFSYSLKKYQSLPLKDRMLLKLKSSRFRFINEQFYSMTGKEALKYFQKDHEAFITYHEGYQTQTQSWPKNPVDVIIKSIKELTAENKNIVVGDFGCGNATLAKSLPGIKVHSFDLVSLDPVVTACDMASTPLQNESLDIAVFCLSLMGTNFSDYLIEANRVLKIGGILKVAEVESRFDDPQNFIESLTKFGFVNTHKNYSCKLFYFMDFKKERTLGKHFKRKAPQLSLKACLYKKR